jgi:2-phosphosulfolactate phosphatase
LSGNQEGYGVRFDWGGVAAARAAGILVIVDVLSFTTAVSVAVERGIAVYPAACADEQLARDVSAALAVGRHEVSDEQPWSLSPAALRAAPAPQALVLPSPNGSAIAAALEGEVVAACLRNARAVAEHVRGRRPVTVIAAGERWPDASLRPALEDLLGAGAVLSALAAGDESPEAAAARLAFEATPSAADAVRACASGVELAGDGFAADVEVAVEIDASDVVPVRADGAFRAG